MPHHVCGLGPTLSNTNSEWIGGTIVPSASTIVAGSACRVERVTRIERRDCIASRRNHEHHERLATLPPSRRRRFGGSRSPVYEQALKALKEKR
jgi:hypothetical protein